MDPNPESRIGAEQIEILCPATTMAEEWAGAMLYRKKFNEPFLFPGTWFSRASA